VFPGIRLLEGQNQTFSDIVDYAACVTLPPKRFFVTSADNGEAMTFENERSGLVTMKGKAVTLVGNAVKQGDRAPDFRAADNAFTAVRLSDFEGKPVLISVVPSLDTGICALQTKRFNEEIAALPKGISVITISTDLPFAQKRFCESEKIDRAVVLSDSVWHEFGLAYGVLIKDMGILARSIFVIGADGKISYLEIVSETASHPDYKAALDAVRSEVKTVKEERK
jgi:thiol peroxidase